jgi:hypothetical protein
MYNPKTHDLFFMQFGFKHPDWREPYYAVKSE